MNCRYELQLLEYIVELFESYQEQTNIFISFYLRCPNLDADKRISSLIISVFFRICTNMSDHKFLSQVYNILKEENVFEPHRDLKYVEFQQPEDLKKLLNLDVDQEEGLKSKEVQEVCRQIIKYSIKYSNSSSLPQIDG